MSINKELRNTNEKYVVLLKVRTPAGISVYHPLATTTAPSYPLPPPTTLVGALAYPYLRITSSKEIIEDSEDSYSPTMLILDKVLYATAGAEGWVPTRDVERVYQLVYQRKDRWDSVDLAYTIGVRGITHYPDNKLYVLYILKDRELAKYAYGIIRIGRKESLVSIEDAVVKELHETLKAVGKGTFETYFYLPEEIAICTNHEIVTFPKLIKENFSRTISPLTEKYCVSKGLGAIRGELKSSGALIKVEDFEIPIPKHFID